MDGSIDMGNGSGEGAKSCECSLDPDPIRVLNPCNGLGLFGPSKNTQKLPILGPEGSELEKITDNARVRPGGTGISKTTCNASVSGPRAKWRGPKA